MGRKRKHNKHLPPKVYHRGKSYYFVDHAGTWHRLGRSLAEMYRSYAGLLENRPILTMGDLFDRYMIEVAPNKAPRTLRDNTYEMKFLRAALAEMDPVQFKPRHGYAYYNARKQKSLKRSLAEMALLSHVFTKAIEWGVVDDNPCRLVRKERPKPRRRYVTDVEYEAAYAAMPPMIQCAMNLAVLTALRPGDLLRLERSNVTEAGLEIHTRKTDKHLIIQWSDELRGVVDQALELPPRFRQPIICNRQGRAYTVDGLNSIWYRRIRKAIHDEDNPLEEPFQFRDLRAKSASDDTAEAASQRLGHADPAVTERIYRRRPVTVRPLR